MNIFVLDENPKIAAQYHNNKHVVKMILDSAQIMSTVIRKQFPDADVYKATHKNHPCTLWAGESIYNLMWLYDLSVGLCNEYTLRYGKTHKTAAVIERCKMWFDKLSFNFNELTPFALAMPDIYKSDSVVESYRTYYLNDKKDILNYKNREVPKWITDGCTRNI